MRDPGFTLLETLLAITLTVSVGIAALSLTMWQAQVGAAARTQEESLALMTETARLLDDDLLLAARLPAGDRYEVLDDGELRLTTACRLPGEPAGLHLVTWRFDAPTATVLRTSTPLAGGQATTHAVGRTWQAFAFDPDHGRLWLSGRVGASADLWRLPLWTEAP